MKNLGICKICDKKLSKKKYFYCRSCRTKIQWKYGIRKTKGIHFSHCIDCNKELKSYKSKRCKKCWYKFHQGINHKLWIEDLFCIDCKRKIYKYDNGIRCRTCNNKFQSNDKNGRWIDGRSYEHYPKDFTLKLRERIRVRDNNKCVICGMTKKEHFKKYNRNLEVHHKDHNKQNCNENNLETRCKRCNIIDNFA